mgnify:CR=1 FL=1
MENKIQELTDKIYREGVEKGNEEAQRLISSARDEAAKIVEDARKEAESILAVARKSAKETAENTQSEIKLFAGQAVNALKTEIATLLTNEVVSESVKGFVADKEYLNKFIVSLLAERLQIPLVASGHDIIWAVGVRLSEKYKVRPDTKRVICLEYIPEGENEDERAD